MENIHVIANIITNHLKCKAKCLRHISCTYNYIHRKDESKFFSNSEAFQLFTSPNCFTVFQDCVSEYTRLHT